MVMQNQMASAGNLIGREIRGLDEYNTPVEGIVTSVRVSDEQVILEIDTGQALPLTRVTHISNAGIDSEPQLDQADPMADMFLANADAQPDTASSADPMADLLAALTGNDESTDS